jgi:gliding motility-associated-like protein
VLPAEGTVGAPTVSAPKPTSPKPVPAPVPTPVTPVTPTPAAPAAPAPSIVSGLSVSPSTLTPVTDGAGVGAAVSFTLASAAQVTVTVTASAGGPPLLTLLSAQLPAGFSTYQWNIGILANGRYRLNVTAQPPSGAASTQSADVIVDRTLGGFSGLPGAFSPNGDGVNDTVSFSFLVTQPAAVVLTVQRAGVTAATVWSAQVAPGMQVVGWDGMANGARLPDGDYVAVLTATTSLGTVALLQAIVVDTTPPGLTVLDGPGLRFDLSEPATVSATVNGQSIVLSQPRGQFAIPFTAGPVTSFTVQARDTAGNVGAVVTGP